MPCLNAKSIALKALTACTRQVGQIFMITNIFHLLDGDLTILSKHHESFIALLDYQKQLHKLLKQQYVGYCFYRTYSKKIYKRDLQKVKGEVPWLTDNDFLKNTVPVRKVWIYWPPYYKMPQYFAEEHVTQNKCQWSIRLWSGWIFLDMKEWLSSYSVRLWKHPRSSQSGKR